MSFKNFKISLKLFLSFSIVILFLVINAIIGIVNLSKIKNESHQLFAYSIWPLESMEALKSEYMKMRVNINSIVANAALGDAGLVETSVANFKNQYSATITAFESAITLLESVGIEDAKIKTLKDSYNAIVNTYYPHALIICDAAAQGDMVLLFEERSKIAPLGAEVGDVLELFFSSRMTEASARTEQVVAVSRRATIILAVSSTAALIFALLVSFFIGKAISNPIVKLSKTANEIANGNLGVNISAETGDEIGDLTNDLNKIHKIITHVVTSINALSAEFEQGNIDSRIDGSGLQGAYKEMVDGINRMLEDIINEVLTMLNAFGKIGGDGDFSASIPAMPGKKILMRQTIESVKANVIAITSEVHSFIAAAADGNLTVRIEPDSYKGGWKEIMSSLNKLMDAVEKPIYESGQVLKHVANGNYDYLVNGVYKGEFLNIKQCINDVVINNSSYIDEISNVLKELANDNLNISIEREYIGKFTDIKIALNNIIDKFNLVISKIAMSASNVASSEKKLSESSLELAQGATQQAAAVEQLNATIQLINHSTTQNADNAKKAELLSANSKESAVKGDAEMKSMLKSIECIRESSNSISDIIKVIDDIAFQTNILALNAAIESARAGINGKGFSAVAEEVRELAGKSKEAAKETADLIVESIEKVQEGTKTADTTAGSLRNIVEAATTVSHIVSDIATASREQAAAISQVSEGIAQITGVVQNNSETSEESASASDELSGQAEMLKSIVSVFKLKNHTTNK